MDSLRGQLTRQGATKLGFRDEIGETRIPQGTLGDYLVQEVLGHHLRMMCGRYGVPDPTVDGKSRQSSIAIRHCPAPGRRR